MYFVFLLCIKCHFGLGPFLWEEVEMMRQEITINWFVTIYKEKQDRKRNSKLLIKWLLGYLVDFQLQRHIKNKNTYHNYNENTVTRHGIFDINTYCVFVKMY